MNNKKIETICLNGGYVPGNGQPRQLPIYQSTTYKYDTSVDMAKLFDLESDGYMYSRLANPTCDAGWSYSFRNFTDLCKLSS